MAYRSMKRIIDNEIRMFESGSVSGEEYDMFRQSSQNKLDVFLAMNRLTSEQYEELTGMLKQVER